jgi:hypothetical protein
MSDRYTRKSANNQTSKPSRTNGTSVPRELGLAKALEEVAKSLPKDFGIDDWAIERLVQDYKNARNEKRKGTQELNALFDKLYGVYVCVNSSPEELDRFLYDCGPKDISVYPGAHLSQILVEFYVQGRSKRAIKYAAALPEAAMQKIKVGSLAQRLGNVGPQDVRTMTSLLQPTSIKVMAKDFANRQKSRGKQAEDTLILTHCS